MTDTTDTDRAARRRQLAAARQARHRARAAAEAAALAAAVARTDDLAAMLAVAEDRADAADAEADRLRGQLAAAAPLLRLGAAVSAIRETGGVRGWLLDRLLGVSAPR